MIYVIFTIFSLAIIGLGYSESQQTLRFNIDGENWYSSDNFLLVYLCVLNGVFLGAITGLLR
jgi:hypothetical protein